MSMMMMTGLQHIGKTWTMIRITMVKMMTMVGPVGSSNRDNYSHIWTLFLYIKCCDWLWPTAVQYFLLKQKSGQCLRLIFCPTKWLSWISEEHSFAFGPHWEQTSSWTNGQTWKCHFFQADTPKRTSKLSKLFHSWNNMPNVTTTVDRLGWPNKGKLPLD